MRRAIELSRKGFPPPNPHVGCVIERNGEILGEGWHQTYGGPHAEVAALSDVGGNAKGATAYVSLEPCNHTGRTGPCSEALIAAGVVKVVYASPDPNPIAVGGAERLKQAGIEVIGGFIEDEARMANLRFLRSFELGRPYVVVKAATSLDGRIALPSGESKWITGEQTRLLGHALRAEAGAVIVGRNTVEKDNPSLTARIDGAVNQPLRVILDPDAKLTADYSVFSDGGQTLRAVKPGKHGLEVPYVNGRFDLHFLLATLGQMGIRSVLVEGGAMTNSSFLDADLADRIELFMAPIVLGAGPSWAEGAGVGSLDHANRFSVANLDRLSNGDVHLSLDRS